MAAIDKPVIVIPAESLEKFESWSVVKSDPIPGTGGLYRVICNRWRWEGNTLLAGTATKPIKVGTAVKAVFISYPSDALGHQLPFLLIQPSPQPPR